ncbi:MAG: hypothetical protein GXY20_11800 [Clostridiales bacterium]|jgi:cytochrome b561|nr:hypothetical protein [Clostridiales bacterium]
MLYSILGFANIALIIIGTSPFWVRSLGNLLFPKRNVQTNKLVKKLRVLHKPLGACLLIVVIVHGYLALGTPRIHTGTLLGIFVLVTVVLGAIFTKVKKPALFKWHRLIAVLSVLLVILHLLAPNALRFISG